MKTKSWFSWWGLITDVLLAAFISLVILGTMILGLLGVAVWM